MNNRQTLELEQFLNEHLNVEDVGWPRLCRKAEGTCGMGRLLVRGNLVLDLPINMNASLGDFISALRAGQEKFRCEWEFYDPSVGGFIGQVASIAADLGFEVHLNCAVAVPAPLRIREFLESGRYDTRKVIVFPGKTPASIELRFTDGHVLVPRRGIDSSVDVPIPTRITTDFDVVLVNPGPRPGRLALLDRLAAEFRSGVGCTTLGIVARGDWTAEDLIRLRHAKCWMFFNRTEALEAANRVRNDGAITNVEEAARVLKSYLGTQIRLVISLDKDGACLLNSKPETQWFPTTPVENGKAAGAGDALTLFTTAASAAGMSEEVSTKLGVEAATNRVAGQPLPRITAE